MYLDLIFHLPTWLLNLLIGHRLTNQWNNPVSICQLQNICPAGTHAARIFPVNFYDLRFCFVINYYVPRTLLDRTCYYIQRRVHKREDDSQEDITNFSTLVSSQLPSHFDFLSTHFLYCSYHYIFKRCGWMFNARTWWFRRSELSLAATSNQLSAIAECPMVTHMLFRCPSVNPSFRDFGQEEHRTATWTKQESYITAATINMIRPRH